jgi:hypothetical protein
LATCPASTSKNQKKAKNKLNEPNQIEDPSWIKPGRYLGIWWGMHMNHYSWQEGPVHGTLTLQLAPGGGTAIELCKDSPTLHISEKTSIYMKKNH